MLRVAEMMAYNVTEVINWKSCGNWSCFNDRKLNLINVRFHPLEYGIHEWIPPGQYNTILLYTVNMADPLPSLSFTPAFSFQSHINRGLPYFLDASQIKTLISLPVHVYVAFRGKYFIRYFNKREEKRKLY